MNQQIHNLVITTAFCGKCGTICTTRTKRRHVKERRAKRLVG